MGPPSSRTPVDERRPRRPRDEGVRVRDVRVEELRVVEHVARQIAPRLERQRDRDDAVNGERGEEDHRRRASTLGEALECAPGATDRASQGRHRASVTTVTAESRATVGGASPDVRTARDLRRHPLPERGRGGGEGRRSGARGHPPLGPNRRGRRRRQWLHRPLRGGCDRARSARRHRARGAATGART